MPGASPERPYRSRGFSIFAGVTLALSASLFSLAVYTYQVRQKYTPIFQEIQCRAGKDVPPKVEKKLFTYPPYLHIRSTATSDCDNPNPFALSVVGGGGQVLLAPKLVPIGTVTVVPGRVEAQNSGHLEKVIDIAIEGGEALAVASVLMTSEVEIILNVSVTSETSLSYLGMKKTTAARKRHICGFKMLVALKTKGPVRCADSYDELVVPSIEHPPIVQRIMLAQDKFDEASAKRDAVTVIAIAVYILLALPLLFCGCRALVGASGGGDTKGEKAELLADDPLE